MKHAEGPCECVQACLCVCVCVCVCRRESCRGYVCRHELRSGCGTGGGEGGG